MFIKRSFLFLLIAGMCCNSAYSQQDGFCDALTTILRDAPNRFHNIRGKELESSVNAIIWDCGIKIPGTISSRFVISMGSFYEGAFFQTNNKDELKPYYDKYKEKLNACLAPHGYAISLGDNFYPGLADYKKLIFMQDSKNDTTVKYPLPHVALEAAYNKDAKNYTLVMYIFER